MGEALGALLSSYIIIEALRELNTSDRRQ